MWERFKWSVRISFTWGLLIPAGLFAFGFIREFPDMPSVQALSNISIAALIAWGAVAVQGVHYTLTGQPIPTENWIDPATGVYAPGPGADNGIPHVTEEEWNSR